jgi:hypothetical protein
MSTEGSSCHSICRALSTLREANEVQRHLDLNVPRLSNSRGDTAFDDVLRPLAGQRQWSARSQTRPTPR